MNNIMLYLSLPFYLIYTFLRINRNIHILQLNSYFNKKYLRWFRSNIHRVFKLTDIIIPLPAIILSLWGNSLLAGILWILAYAILILLRERKEEKKKLHYTSRVKRLFGTNFILMVLIFSILYYLNPQKSFETFIFTELYIVNIIAFALVLISNFINMPLEKAINNWYLNDAKKKIGLMPGLTVIGITGSFGKTSTKYILNRILSERFNVLMTPESYNTTMGVTITIRKMLKPIHNIFIAEMGATKRGDIKEICQLVAQRIGILTSIGEQHLESFKNLENIKKTKFELIDTLPEGGEAFLNWDDVNIKSLPPKKGIKIIRYGIQSENIEYKAQDIKFTSKGSEFIVKKYDGTEAHFKTKLLGTHNIYNILAAIAVASELGIDFPIISRAVKKLEPVPHRLELKQSPNKITIIDDAFNANPVGSKMALEVLGELAGDRKILITPGMVELGDKQFEYNKEFGMLAAQICDYVILVGPRQTKPIQVGLAAKKFAENKLYIAKDLKDAINHMNSIVNIGDIVLFENDLPDTYNE